MNPLDWLLAVLLTYSVVRATMRGFFREAFSLGGVLLGFLLACWNYRAAGKELRGLIDSVPLSELVGFLAILTGTMVIATVLGGLLRKTASTIGLGVVDRLLGAAFGLLRGGTIAVALLLVLSAFLPAAPWITTSLCAPYFLHAAHAVSFVMPAELRHRLLDGMEPLKQVSPGWIHPFDKTGAETEKH